MTVHEAPVALDGAPSVVLPTGVVELVGFQCELVAVLSRGEGVPGLAAALRRRSGKNVQILDGLGRVLAGTCVECALLGPPPDGVLAKRLAIAGPGRAVEWEGRWVASSCPSEEPDGFVVLCDHEKSAAEFDLLALTQTALMLGLELVRLRSVADAELVAWGDLTNELLDGPDISRARRHARQLGHDPDVPHRAVVVAAPSGRARALLSTVCSEVSRSGRTLATIRDHDVVLLLDGEPDWLRLATTLKARYGAAIRVGVGGSYDLSSMRRSLADAKFALALTATLGSAGPVACFEDLGIWRLFAASAGSADLLGVVTEWLDPLVAYDEQRGGELVKTIRTYLHNSGEIETTANELFIHRNTLVYRLKRIGQILGHDLTDPDTRFSIDLACRAWMTMQAISRLDGG